MRLRSFSPLAALLTLTLGLLACGQEALRFAPPDGGAGSGPSTGAAGLAGAAGAMAAAGTNGAAGTSGAGTPLPPTLTPADLALKLSLYLWNTTPDDELTRQLYAAPPQTSEDVRRVAETMLADPRGRDGVRAFFHLWLKLDRLATAKKDPAAFPEYTPALRAAMVAEAEAFALDVTFDGDGRFPTLLTASYSMLNQTLAPFYGVPGITGPDLRKVALDPLQRAGVFTLLAVLASSRDSALPAISSRGVFVAGLLGRQIPPEPPGLSPPAPIPPNLTEREWLAMSVGVQPQCAACHSLMDPPGFAFGHYDTLGRFQVTDHGKNIDAQATLGPAFGGELFMFDGAPELARKFAEMPEAIDAFVDSWFAFASVPFRDPTSSQQARADFVRAGLDIRTLILAVTATPVFLGAVRP